MSVQASTVDVDRSALVCFAVVSACLANYLAWFPNQPGGRPSLVSEEQWGGQVRLVSYLQSKVVTVFVVERKM